MSFQTQGLSFLSNCARPPSPDCDRLFAASRTFWTTSWAVARSCPSLGMEEPNKKIIAPSAIKMAVSRLVSFWRRTLKEDSGRCTVIPGVARLGAMPAHLFHSSSKLFSSPATDHTKIPIAKYSGPSPDHWLQGLLKPHRRIRS